MIDKNRLKGSRFDKFIKLRSKFSLVLSLLILGIYILFLIAVGAYPNIQTLGYKIGPSSVSLGIVVGAFIIILCIVLTGLYTFVANKFFDKELQSSLRELREQKILKDEEEVK